MDLRFWRQSEPVVQSAPQQEPVPEVTHEDFEEYRDEDEEEHLTEALALQRRAEGLERKRWLAPQQVAEMFVAYLRLHDYCALPHLVDDLDEAIDKWCDKNRVEPVNLSHVRECMRSLVGVSCSFKRLSERNPRHAPLIRRLKAMGRGTRATIYTVSPRIPAATANPTVDLEFPVAAVASPPATPKKAPKRRISRIETGQEQERKRILPSDDSEDLEIGWEIPDRRYA